MIMAMAMAMKSRNFEPSRNCLDEGIRTSLREKNDQLIETHLFRRVGGSKKKDLKRGGRHAMAMAMAMAMALNAKLQTITNGA